MGSQEKLAGRVGGHMLDMDDSRGSQCFFKKTRISIETVSFSQFQWVYFSKKGTNKTCDSSPNVGNDVGRI
jgi:hypothetical protein